MDYNLTIGYKARNEIEVTYEDTAKNINSGLLEVLSTPSVIALMESTSVDAVQSLLPEGYSTVGTSVNIKHLAATPIGMKVNAEAELIDIDNRKLTFKIKAFNEKELVSEGIHERFIVNNERFIDKAYNK
ncbi:MAG: thioesterase family protein [Vulcanibacillus sp.]